ncbi:MAG: GspE/PulE family protein [Phycisphaerae bacterium]
MKPAVPGVVELVDAILHRAAAARASDVHFEPGLDAMRVRFRVDSLLTDAEIVPAAIAAGVVARLKVLARLLTYRTDIAQDGAIPAAASGVPCDIRVATFPTIRGERVVLRLMAAADRLLELDQLGHSDAIVATLIAELARPQGFLLVCGPAGSGKTTTLYAMLAHLRRMRPDASIIAIEDPVEIRCDGITQVQIDPPRGLTYPAALRSLLRQDPQILLIGEIRDSEVASIVTEAALTGHLLLASMHAGSAPEAILRLLEMGIPAYQVTSTLCGVLNQRLVRRRASLADGGGPIAAPQYSGRVAVGEWVQLSPLLRRAIIDGGDLDALRAASGATGGLATDAQRLIDAGLSDEAEINRALGAIGPGYDSHTNAKAG